MAIRAYQQARGQGHRNVCLIPVSAHGTNPASAVMAGMRVVIVASDEAGNVDMADLKAKAALHKDELSESKGMGFRRAAAAVPVHQPTESWKVSRKALGMGCDCKSLYELLSTLIKHVLGCSEDKLLQFLQLRCLNDTSKAFEEEMAEVEEAGAKVYVSNLVVMEAYFACQHHYGMAKEDVIEGLRKLLSVPTFMTHPELQGLLAMEGLARAKLGLLDRLIHAEARTARLESVTFEKAAGRLGGVRLLASAE
jgi:predicted nucleic-acid-binding protein